MRPPAGLPGATADGATPRTRAAPRRRSHPPGRGVEALGRVVRHGRQHAVIGDEVGSWNALGLAVARGLSQSIAATVESTIEAHRRGNRYSRGLRRAIATESAVAKPHHTAYGDRAMPAPLVA